MEYEVNLAQEEAQEIVDTNKVLVELSLGKTRYNIDKDTIYGKLLFKKLPMQVVNSNFVRSIEFQIV